MIKMKQIYYHRLSFQCSFFNLKWNGKLLWSNGNNASGRKGNIPSPSDTSEKSLHSFANGEGNGTHSSTLPWRILWTEEPGGLQSMGSLRVWHNWATSLSLFTYMHWKRKRKPTPVFLPGEFQGPGSLVASHLWGCRVGHNWSDLAAATIQFP